MVERQFDVEAIVEEAVRNPARLEALRRTLLLDTPPDPTFDKLTRLVTRILQVPVALVSLVDADRQFFVGCVGLPEPWATTRQTPLTHSFCQHTVAREELLLIEDARVHPLVRENLAIRDLNVIAYAGVPLKTSDGQILGSLCAIDSQPRRWSDDDVAILQDLGATTVTEIELRLAIREREELVAELASRQAMLQAILEQLPSGVMIAEAPSGRLIMGNRQIEQIMRHPFYRAKDVQGYSQYQGFHPDGQPFVPGDWPLARTISNNERLSTEIQILRGDGTKGFLDVRSAPIMGAGEQAIAAVVVFSDITERKQTEEALRLSEERFRTLFNAVPQLVWQASADGKLEFLNERWYSYTGSTPADVERWLDYIHPEDRNQLVQIRHQAIDAGVAYNLEARIRRNDGIYLWHSAQIVPLRDDKGSIVGWLGATADIDQHKRESQALSFLSEAGSVLASSLDYQATLSQVSDLLVPDRADFCFIHIAGSDGELQQVLQHHRDPAREEQLASLLQPSRPGAEQLLSALRHVLETGEEQFIPISSQRQTASAADGDFQEHYNTLRPTWWLMVPLVARSQLRGVLTLGREHPNQQYGQSDLVMAKNMALRIALALENARLYHDAQDAIRERETMLSLASHELKNPLSSLLGYASLLERRLAPGNVVTEREQRQLRTITSQGQRLAKMLDVMLDVARIDQGQLRIQPAPVDLHALVSRIISEFEPVLTDHRIDYSEPDVPAIVRGDELRLEQVVRNLVGNAVKYSPDGGTISVHLGLAGGRARLVVKDNGIGIPTAALPRLFQRFSRVENARSGEITGLGLGLYVVKEVISLHGGTIEVASVEGVGSTFTVVLPALLLDTPGY